MALLRTKHKAAYEAAIHDADPGRDLCVQYYGRNDKLTRKQVVCFQQVVRGYLANIGVRTEAGHCQTALQIAAAAIVQIKVYINGGLYPALNLPNSLP